MSTLLVQSCSQTKRDVDRQVPALDLYTGYFFKIIKKAIREGEIRDDLDICILSAKHGLLSTQERIGNYERRMDAAQAAELNAQVVSDLRERIRAAGYERVVVNMGAVYREAIEGFAGPLNVEVQHIEGTGIGHKGRTLKRVVRGDDAPLEVES